MNQHFAYAIDTRYLPVLVPFGLRRTKDGVTLTDDSFLATFGFFKLATQLTNITGAHITRNYRWWTAFGVRGSRADDGLTFGTSPKRSLGAHRDGSGLGRACQGLGRRSCGTIRWRLDLKRFRS
jgi:hypothetical protein